MTPKITLMVFFVLHVLESEMSLLQSMIRLLIARGGFVLHL